MSLSTLHKVANLTAFVKTQQVCVQLRIRPHSPAAAAATIDQYLLFAWPTAANLQQQ